MKGFLIGSTLGCGAELAGELLAQFPQVLSGPPTGVLCHPSFWNAKAKPLPFAPSSVSENLPWFYTDAARLIRDLSECASPAGRLERVFGFRMKLDDASYWMDSTSANLYAMHDFLTSTEDSTGIIIHRNGWDAISHMMGKEGIGFKGAAKMWVAEMALVKALQAKFPPSRIVCISYESLLDSPEVALSVLGLPVVPLIKLTPNVGGELSLTDAQKSHFLWLRTNSSIASISAGEGEFADELMRHFGYPAERDKSAPWTITKQDQSLGHPRAGFTNSFSVCAGPKEKPGRSLFSFLKKRDIPAQESPTLPPVFHPSPRKSESADPVVVTILCDGFEQHLRFTLEGIAKSSVAPALIVAVRSAREASLAKEYGASVLENADSQDLVKFVKPMAPEMWLSLASGWEPSPEFIGVCRVLMDSGRGGSGTGFDLVGVRDCKWMGREISIVDESTRANHPAARAYSHHILECLKWDVDVMANAGYFVVKKKRGAIYHLPVREASVSPLEKPESDDYRRVVLNERIELLRVTLEKKQQKVENFREMLERREAKLKKLTDR